ncbi:hypothetical protein CgunFtcFv8_005199 [Champsocephalus gunnari]|uniref:Uncharacterized protein n=1 Tax=Champsocephalus gunnari TaxID=52237 RepID=A0AAN8CV43_CHAGU|nr:hypothetical protein CgunFtcFv8_005199 [Champsocephalus gunnari]
MSALKSSSSHGLTTPLCPPHPNPLSSRPSHPPFDISRPPSALSALVVYNMAISCLWQMKDSPWSPEQWKFNPIVTETLCEG